MRPAEVCLLFPVSQQRRRYVLSIDNGPEFSGHTDDMWNGCVLYDRQTRGQQLQRVMMTLTSLSLLVTPGTKFAKMILFTN